MKWRTDIYSETSFALIEQKFLQEYLHLQIS